MLGNLLASLILGVLAVIVVIIGVMLWVRTHVLGRHVDHPRLRASALLDSQY